MGVIQKLLALPGHLIAFGTNQSGAEIKSTADAAVARREIANSNENPSKCARVWRGTGTAKGKTTGHEFR